jgi:hypothetical protein
MAFLVAVPVVACGFLLYVLIERHGQQRSRRHRNPQLRSNRNPQPVVRILV